MARTPVVPFGLPGPNRGRAPLLWWPQFVLLFIGLLFVLLCLVLLLYPIYEQRQL